MKNIRAGLSIFTEKSHTVHSSILGARHYPYAKIPKYHSVIGSPQSNAIQAAIAR
uniref:Uncharacterized protein n=1 Tax=Candidatus Kentrum sp. SD TaxID=2126332 RepID=A0A450Z611_9GAMM|nr:MAG: hypothetical protein BECKSD772E_GA0070983_11673 [Candidatus Kentron sp. SD]VFK80137.1 MAG: hypothetical protein BECKSD772D_GA0070982_108711 [Candidatus Kentron sp. SD]